MIGGRVLIDVISYLSFVPVLHHKTSISYTSSVSFNRFHVLHVSFIYVKVDNEKVSLWGSGGQWLSGRVLDLRPRGRGFESHRRHCVVSLSKTH